MENLLTLISLAKTKQKVLAQMMELDLNNQTDTNDYIKLLNNYKLVCEVYDKKLRTLTEIEKNEILSKIKLLNPEVLTIPVLETLLQENNRSPLTRVILDLSNSSLMSFYQNKNGNVASKIFSMLGINHEEETTINTEIVNEYMNQDFINQFFLTLKNNIEKETNPNYRKLLFYWKYQSILLSSSLERRALMTNFSIPDSAKLTDILSIETTGLTTEEYITAFDSKIAGDMFLILKVTTSLNKTNNFYLDLIIFEALANLLNSKDYYEIIELELESSINLDLPLERQEKLNEILEVLRKNKNNNLNTKENRQYIKI